jgi:O-acetyl-ADP-ribose deacetylase (regulator of RNase III)
MKEIKKDLFECALEEGVDAICITTNGHYTLTGEAVMGGGCAGEAARRWPECCTRLGKLLKSTKSNIPFVIAALDENGNYLEPSSELIKNKQYKCLVFSFPTINKLINGSNLQLIKQSTVLLVDYVNQYKLNNVILPRPGVGIGGLQWSEVKEIISPLLDDRFTIVSFTQEE